VTVTWVRAERARLDSFEAAGVDRVVLGVASVDAGVVARKLDKLVKLARLQQVRKEVVSWAMAEFAVAHNA
jgi:hypothetical protein